MTGGEFLMLARIIDDKWIYIEQASVAEEGILDDEFSVKHPRAQYIDAGVGFFDGVYHKYNKFHHRLARPFLHELEAACNKHGLPLMIVDNRPSPKYKPKASDVTPDLLSGITLDQHQIDGIKSVCTEEVGIISCPTGGGKSEMMAGIAKIMNCPTIILCDMTVVVDQLKNRLELRGVTEEVGMFYAGRRPNGQQIIVGSFQSLTIPSVPKKTKKDTPETYAKKLKAFKTRRRNARKLREIVSKCDLLLVDECDVAGRHWRNLFWHWFKGRRRYGFSGTPYDPSKPVNNMLLREHLGNIIFEVDRRELEKIGRIIPVSYTALAVGDDANIKDKSAYDIAMKEHLIESPSFHKLVKVVTEKSLIDPSYGALILVESKPLGYALESIISDSKFICGDHRMTERKKTIQSFENRETRVLIGGKIVKRGLDLKGGCEILVIATGGKLQSDFNQKVGRAVRKNKRGCAQIYDFFFLCNHYLYGHSRKRLKTIVSMGYDAKVIFKKGVIDAQKFIKSRFRRPK